jgi:uncharacterized repeat protein (TIGR03803 family)
MPVCHTLFRVALLGSALGIAALIPAAGANPSRADLERSLAATGNNSSVSQQGVDSVSHFRVARQPSTYTVLHNFAGPPGDGQDSGAEVTLDSSGNIDGTTDFGGANGAGVIFQLAPGGTEMLLHSFGGAGDGSTPDGAVSIESNGDMIGTTESGGSSSNGVIFKLAADGTYTVLHSFASNEGNFLRGRLIQDKKGNFYGTALFGGTPGDGTVFKYSAKGKLTVLHAFTGADGEFPEHGVVSDKSGNLYGVTAFGGASDNGTVYEIAKDGTFTSLYSFTGGADGGFLYGGLAIDKDGNLYGSTVSGGANGQGTVFKLTPGGTPTTLYSFTGGTDGGSPEGDMLLAGNDLYSMATSGGDQSCGCGAIYEITAKGKEKVLHAFTGTDGGGYSAGLTASGHTFYGTTASDGANGYGVVFSVTRK